MNKQAYDRVLDNFKAYTDRFIQRTDDSRPFELKIDHTGRVCENMNILARELSFDNHQMRTSMAAALLHDIGRFPQYETYGTFSDSLSETHGVLGVKVLQKQNVLSHLEKEEQQRIIRSVSLHNVFALPKKLDPELMALTRLLRDADKIDIFRVMVDLYRTAPQGKSSFITHHLPDDGQISEERVQDILKQRLIDVRNIKTLNDMKLLQISWVFDLNFPAARNLVKKRKYISAILSTLPGFRSKEKVQEVVTAHLEREMC